MALQEGWLGKKDLRKSFAYTSELADDNNPGAIFDLASKFAEGIGCIKNERKALELYLRAAELGSHEAAMMLSMVFSNGLLGQKPDPRKADHYLRLSESLLGSAPRRPA
jgi:TPR repeat protein